jgi:hypothetical protein
MPVVFLFFKTFCKSKMDHAHATYVKDDDETKEWELLRTQALCAIMRVVAVEAAAVVQQK